MESEISSQSNRSAIGDPLSPFFLHYSDSPGLVLVSQQLTGDNYPSDLFALVESARVEVSKNWQIIFRWNMPCPS